MNMLWRQLNERERRMLIIGAVCCGFYLWYAVLYAPLTRATQDRTRQLLEKKETLVWMQQVREQYHAQHALKTVTTSQLLTVLTQQLTTSALRSFPYRLQQTGRNEVQLSFETVPYNLFLQWLWSMNETHAMAIKQLTVNRTASPGIVKIMLVIAAQ